MISCLTSRSAIIYLSVCIAQECKSKYHLTQCAAVLIQCTGILMSSLQYQGMNCYYIRIYGTKWLQVSRLHDEYTYRAVNTHTLQYALSMVTLTARACATRMNCLNDPYYSW